MFYNLLNYPEAPPSNRDEILKDLIEEVQPDIFMVCELQNQIGANLILNNVLNSIGETVYTMPEFIENTSSSNQSIQQHIYFDESKFSLHSTDIIQTQLRDINYYRLEVLNNTNEEALYLDVFVAHLKAAQGDSNVLIRSEMVNDFTTYLANLPSDANVIFAGDFNFYTANESGFLQLLMGQSTILFSDPIDAPGDWNNNFNFSSVHTQSTRTSSSNFDGFGAGGGLDDRFDFILVSSNMMNENHAISYIPNTYVAYGNNGNCFNKNISDTSCFGEFSQQTRNLLYNMSDHLPVVMQLNNANASLMNENWNASKELLSFLDGNLVQEYLRLHYNSILSNKTEVLIFNSLGKNIKSIKGQAISEQIDISHLSSGVYIVKVVGFPQTYRFIKQ